MTERGDIEQAIRALEKQRDTLGDAVFNVCVAALRQQLSDQNHLDATLKGERKHVTVMFADISGFTAMSEKLDPEDVRSMINACFAWLSDPGWMI